MELIRSGSTPRWAWRGITGIFSLLDKQNTVKIIKFQIGTVPIFTACILKITEFYDFCYRKSILAQIRWLHVLEVCYQSIFQISYFFSTNQHCIYGYLFISSWMCFFINFFFFLGGGATLKALLILNTFTFNTNFYIYFFLNLQHTADTENLMVPYLHAENGYDHEVGWSRGPW